MTLNSALVFISTKEFLTRTLRDEFLCCAHSFLRPLIVFIESELKSFSDVFLLEGYKDTMKFGSFFPNSCYLTYYVMSLAKQ